MKRVIKIFIIYILCFCILFGGFSSIATDTGLGGTISVLKSFTPALNASYKAISANHETNGTNNANIFQYKPSSSVLPVMNYGTQITGGSTPLEMINNEKAKGKEVFGAVNSDFFIMATGIPMGIVIKDKILRSSANAKNAVGFMADGSAIIERPVIDMRFKINDGVSLPIAHLNKGHGNQGVYLYNEDFASTTRSTLKSVEAVFKITEGEFKLGQVIKATCESVNYETTQTKLQKGYFVLSEAVSSLYTKRLTSIKAGDNIELSFTPQNPKWLEVIEASGADVILVENAQKPLATLETKKEPRTAVGIKADGSVIFITVDGRNAGGSAGISLDELSNELIKMGCVTAVNLDGGGSTAMYMREPGIENASLCNVPSEGYVRAVSTGFVFVNTAPKTNVVAGLMLNPKTPVVMSGAQTKFTTNGYDTSYYFLKDIKGVSYNLLEPKKGVVDQSGLFTANKNEPSGTQALEVSLGSVKALFNIEVSDKISELKVNFDKLDILPGGEANLIATAFLNGKDLLFPQSVFNFEILSGNIGQIDQNGYFKASHVVSSKGVIRVRFVSKYVDIPVAIKDEGLIFDFDKDVQALTTPATNELMLKKSGENMAYLGDGAAEIGYSFAESQSLEIKPSAGGVWLNNASEIEFNICGDNSKNSLYFTLTDQMGEQKDVLITSLDYRGYKSFKLQLDNTKLLNLSTVIKIKKEQNSSPTGDIYLDEVRINKSGDVIDKNAPNIELKAQDGVLNPLSLQGFSVIESQPDGLMSGISKINAFLDGIELEVKAGEGSEQYFVIIPENITEGIHKLQVTATDNAKNKTKKMFEIKVNGLPYTKSFTDLEKSWSKPYVYYAAENNILSGYPQNDKSYKFFPDNNITRQEFAKIIATIKGLDLQKYKEVTIPFADISKIQPWALDYIKAVYAEGIIKGTSVLDKLYFYPTGAITRAEVMTILKRLMLPVPYTEQKLEFKDSNLIPAYAYEAIFECVKRGIVSGYSDNTIKPLASIKRGEVAKLIFGM